MAFNSLTHKDGDTQKAISLVRAVSVVIATEAVATVKMKPRSHRKLAGLHAMAISLCCMGGQVGEWAPGID